MKFIRKHVEIISSTNTELLKNFNNHENYTILSTDHQTSGKGRLNRIWEDNSSGNLMYSVLLKNVVKIDEINRLNYSVCAATIKMLEHYNIESKYKWPNDILVNDAKVSGVLIETKFIDDGIVVVIGQGINVNNNADETSDYTFMSDIFGCDISKEEVFEILIGFFKEYFLTEKAYNLCKENHSYSGKEIVIDDIKYIIGGINTDGSVTLINDDSKKITFFGSELSISKKEVYKNE